MNDRIFYDGQSDRIFYDGQCDFCLKMTTFLELEQNFLLIDLNNSSLDFNQFPLLSKKSLEEKIHIISNTGKIYAGGEALSEIFLRNKYTSSLLRPLHKSWIGKKIFNMAYSLISTNRSFANLLFNFCAYSFHFKIKAYHILWIILTTCLIGGFLKNQNQTLTSYFAASFFYSTLYLSWKNNQVKLSPIGVLIGNSIYAATSLFLATKLASVSSTLAILVLLNLRLQFKTDLPIWARYFLSTLIFSILLFFSLDTFLLYHPLIMGLIFYFPLKQHDLGKAHNLTFSIVFSQSILLFKLALIIGIGIVLKFQH